MKPQTVNALFLYVLLGSSVIYMLFMAFQMLEVVMSGWTDESVADAVSKNALTSAVAGTLAEGDVYTEMLPRAIADGVLVVDVVMSANGLDLSEFDVVESTVLNAGGREVHPRSPVSMNGNVWGGQLVFEVGGDVSDFVIVMKDIPKGRRREFRWE